jgi:kumamolisin
MAASSSYSVWHEIKGSGKKVARGAHVAEPADPKEVIEVLVRLKRKTKLPGPPKPGQRMTRKAFEAKHGSDPADIKKVQAFAKHFRLAVAQVLPAERSLILKGKVADLEKAFKVELRRHRFDNEASYRGRVGTISVPSAISDAVVGVFGLDDRPVVWRALRVEAPAAAAAGGSQTRGPITEFFPNQLARLYNFPTGVDGTGQNIGIVELGGGYRNQDLGTYFAKAGVAHPPSFVTRPVKGGATNAPAPNDQDQPDVEVLLDMEVAGTVAPGAKLFMYFVKDGSDKQILLGISAAVHDKTADISVLSLSFGGPEYDTTTMGTGQGDAGLSQWQDNLNDIFQGAGQLGITVCVATGDQASFGIPTNSPYFDGKAHASFPASSPYALACGGTHIVTPTAGHPVEEVWHPATGVGTGGGISRYFAVPSYQTGIVTQKSVNPAGGTGRGLPDVCADAAQESGYRVLCDGLWYPDATSNPQRPPIGGTSASTPLWAGLIALMNQSLKTRIGFINPLLYKIGSPSGAFFDVTKGNNGDYQAKAGWDPCTGLGSPNGVALLAALKPLLSRAAKTVAKGRTKVGSAVAKGRATAKRRRPKQPRRHR